MIIRYLNIVRIAIFKSKAHSPLVVDENRMLPSPVSLQFVKSMRLPRIQGPATGYVVLQIASTQRRGDSETTRRWGGRALRSSASRNGPFGWWGGLITPLAR